MAQPRMTNESEEPLLEKGEAEAVVDWGSEAKRVLALAVPITTKEVLSFLAYLITTAQVGWLGSAQLSAITLGRSVFHITGLSLVIGLASGVSTLAGQAFGAGQHALVGTLTQRAIVLVLLLSALVLLGWSTQLEPLMLLLGQDPTLSRLASRYILLISPALVMEGVMYCLRNYLTCQGIVRPLTAVAAVQTICTPIINHLFIHVLDMGLDGVAAAYNITVLIDLVLVVLVTWGMSAFWQAPGEKTWPPWSRSCFAGWGHYLKVALPSLAMICADWWCFEAIILVAGVRKDADVQLAVMGILFATHTLAFFVYEGFSGAATTRVSNLLGAGSGSGARTSMGVCLTLGSLAAFASAAALTATSRPWTHIFSEDTRVIDAAMKAMPWMAASLLGDGCNSVFTGVLQGAGRQGLGFLVNLVAYWVMGLPLAYGMSQSRGVEGMWMAMAAISAMQAVVLGLCVLRFDWQAEAERACHMVSEGARSMTGAAAATTCKEAAPLVHHHGPHDPLLASHPGTV